MPSIQWEYYSLSATFKQQFSQLINHSQK